MPPLLVLLPSLPWRPGPSPPGADAAPPSDGVMGVAELVSVSAASASAASASCASLLVLELALDDLGLVATAGSLNPHWHDVLVIGGQDSLQLRRERVRLQFGVNIHRCALVVKCSCIHAVVKIDSIMRAFGCDYILLSSKQQNIYLKCI